MTEREPLISVVYSSDAVSGVSDADLQQLLAVSRENNLRAHVTGMLLYRGGRFIQVLEGPADAITELLERIATDPRHTAVRILFREPLEQRHFADWTMGYEPISAPLEALPAAFRDTFDDLEASENPSATLRAIRELTLWFQVRSRASA